MDPLTDFSPQLWSLNFQWLTVDTLVVELTGNWKLQDDLPSADDVLRESERGASLRQLKFNTERLSAWDTGLLTFLIPIEDYCHKRNIDFNAAGLPQGVKRLLDLASAVPEKKDTGRELDRDPILTRIGMGTVDILRTTGEMLEFIGEAVLTFSLFLRGKARFRFSDFALTLQECGAQALPIVTLISLLVGLILAFVGAVQLEQFGAEIYVANLVGLGMVREMGAMMTAVIMAGRTGAAFAAQLGTMRVNEEIDALKTMGISPMEFLVLPRMLALMLMMPLLCLYSDLLGILGGAFVGWSMLDLPLIQYFDQTKGAIALNDFMVGLIKSAVFGVLVAVSGCLRGMQCGRSSSAVGIAATSAVVTGIVFIIVSDSIFTVVFNFIGF